MKFSIKPKFTPDTMGYLVACALGVVLLSSGFAPNATSYATVDMAKLIDNSKPGKATQDKLNAAKQTRLDLLQFMYQNRVMTADQAQQLAKLSVAAAPSPADQATLKDLKTQIMAASKAYEDLQAKTTLTAQDQTTLANDRSEITVTGNTISQMAQQFNEEMQQMQQTDAAALLTQVRTAVQAAGKAQGYTVVLSSSSAPFCDHDLTDTVMGSLNSQ